MRNKFLVTFSLIILVLLMVALVACNSTQVETYTISFSGTDSEVGAVSVTAGAIPQIPSVPAKAGYTGVWTLDGSVFDAKKAFDYGKNIELKAQYTLLAYNVVFKADGVQVGETQTYTIENKTITIPTVPEKVGYTAAWESYTLTTGDVTINAVYTPVAYNVVFKADGVQVGETQTYTVENKTITVPTVPAKAGYTAAWESYTLTTGDVTVNAVYTLENYNVVFMADGVQVGETQTYTIENKTITIPTVPEKVGYTAAWESYTLTTGDVTINAVYTPVVYNVTFKADGNQVGETQTYTVENKTITVPTVPAKAGYTAAWESYTLTTGDVTVNAVYTLENYNVVFMADGVQVGETQTYTIENKTITIPTVPEKVGYTAAWESYTLTTGDVTINAVYTAKTNTKYTVEHYFENVNGEYVINSEKTQELQGTTDTSATAAALVVDHYTENTAHADRVVSGNIAGNGSLVLKLYYKLDTVNVTFDYGTVQNSTTVAVKYGAKVSASQAASIDEKYPYAITGWKNGSANYDFTSTVVEDITLNAVFANEGVFDDFETEKSWKNTTNATKDYVTTGVISGSQSMQFVATSGYNGIYRQNLNDVVDFTDVNYIYFKVKVSATAEIRLRFYNTNGTSGTPLQLGQSIKADGAWHLVCIDMSAIGTTFAKTEIKTMLIASTVANITVEIDDITFVKDNSLVQGAVACYDFEDQNGWTASSSDTTKCATSYVTDAPLSGNQSMQVTATAYNGIYNQNINNTEFANVNYVYVKVKASTTTTLSIRLFSGTGIGNNYVTVTGSTVKTEGEYQIIKFDISNWSGLSATGTAFEKSGTKTMLIRTGVAATLVVDDVILSTSELYN